MDFGKRLKTARINKDLTQEQVATDLFVTRQTISSWENEKTYPDINSLIRLSDYYQISLDTLLKEDQGMRDYLELTTIKKSLRPVYISLLLTDLFLGLTMGLYLFTKWDLTSPLLGAMFSTIISINQLARFDHSNELGLRFKWQRYLGGEKGRMGMLIIPMLLILVGIVFLFIEPWFGLGLMSSVGLLVAVLVFKRR